MEAMGSSFWGFEENVDELKNMLLLTTVELETARSELKTNMKRNEENVKQLLYFFKIACQERDEARDQFQKLLNKLMPLNPIEMCPALPILQPESPMNGVRATSSLTISDSLSETYNPHSYVSSPVDSLLDRVSSPDVPNINVADSSNSAVPPNVFVQDYKPPTAMPDSINLAVPSQVLVPDYNSPTAMPQPVVSSNLPEPDHASLIIDSLVKGKPLPEKGKLVQAVTDAGPLLQTILLSGHLPQWRNPPPAQPFQVPPFSIKSPRTGTINMNPISNRSHPVQSSLTEISYGSPQLYSTSMLGNPGISFNKGEVISSGLDRDFSQSCFMTGKRQRCQ